MPRGKGGRLLHHPAQRHVRLPGGDFRETGVRNHAGARGGTHCMDPQENGAHLDIVQRTCLASDHKPC